MMSNPLHRRPGGVYNSELVAKTALDDECKGRTGVYNLKLVEDAALDDWYIGNTGVCEIDLAPDLGPMWIDDLDVQPSIQGVRYILFIDTKTGKLIEINKQSDVIKAYQTDPRAELVLKAGDQIVKATAINPLIAWNSSGRGQLRRSNAVIDNYLERSKPVSTSCGSKGCFGGTRNRKRKIRRHRKTKRRPKH
jgi:hypothetical protein